MGATRRDFIRTSAGVSLAALAGCTAFPLARKRPPNIVYILADDLGYGDLGCYGQQRIETPNLDRLRAGGMRFTQHYSGSPVCAPSRCVLLTGKHSGHAYIRGNDEWASRGKVWDYQAVVNDPGLEGQRPIPGDTLTFPKLLQAAGYTTAAVGKWGLGPPGSEGAPERQGFDLFFGYNCQRQAHTYYPKHLYRNAQRLSLSNELVVPGTKLPAGAGPLDPASYARYTQAEYAPDLMFAEITSFVAANRERPFFLYWATTIPHAALQAPPRWMDYYVRKFGDEPPYLGNQGYFPLRYPHACYAGMVSYLDEQVGLLLRHLEDLGLRDDTLVMFSSDNGPTYNGGTDSPWFASAGPFRCEAGWGKGSLREGGIRVPFIASWPGHIQPGTESDRLCAFWDLLPTFCDLAGAPIPADTDGISFAPTLLGSSPQPQHPYLYWEYPEAGGHQAVRMGRWKGLRQGIRKGDLTLALYDLDTDLQEEHDVADAHPDTVSEIENRMREAHTTPALESFRMKPLGD